MAVQITFPPGEVVRKCVNIEIIDDRILENDETFSLVLTTEDTGRVRLTRKESVATILNDDGNS